MRVVGDPKLQVRKVALVPGASGFAKETRALEISDLQVLVTGEPREWETVEYVADAVTEGKPKALIILGHIPSEQAGMEECARWNVPENDQGLDRKSTRLNSSHANISYAVFCLKQKT